MFALLMNKALIVDLFKVPERIPERKQSFQLKHESRSATAYSVSQTRDQQFTGLAL